MTRISFRNAARPTGFSLIEVMVAVLVLSVGLLGMAALMATSLRNGQSSNYRTQATNLAYEVIDMMRGNMANIGRYNMTAYTTPPTDCTTRPRPATNYSTLATVHNADVTRWTRDLCATLPNGRGRVQITRGTGTDYNVQVDICWSDDRAATASTTCANTAGASETVFTFTTSL